MRNSLVAVTQLTSTNDIEFNFVCCEKLIQQAAQQGASLICLPENFASFSGTPLGDSLLTRYCALAKQYQIWVSLGGYLEREGEHVFNTHIIVDDKGNITARYRKIHLFSINMPDNPSLDESKTITAGNEIICTESPVGHLGLSICYDLRFPALFTSMHEMGAQVLLIPAAFTATTGKAHWEVLLRARAIENQCYVIAAAQVGVNTPTRHTHGHAMIIDPWGTVIAECSSSDTLAFASIDLSYLNSVRSRIPVLSHRRHDLY